MKHTAPKAAGIASSPGVAVYLPDLQNVDGFHSQIATKTGLDAEPMRVVVQSPAGEICELHVKTAMQVKQLKEMIAKEWHVPPSCQTLVFGTTRLQDSDGIASLCDDVDLTLHLTMIVSLEEVRTESGNFVLAHSAGTERQDADSQRICVVSKVDRASVTLG